MDANTIGVDTLKMMLAMTKPMQHLVWVYGSHGEVRAVPLVPDLPGRPFNRLDPGYRDPVDDEICQRILIPCKGGNGRCHGNLLKFPPDVLAMLERARR